jgi:hypothetical protein
MFPIIGAVAGGTLGLFGAVGDARAQNKAALENYKAAIKAISTNYNYGVLSKSTSIKSEFNKAKRTLENLAFNSRQNQSTIKAAMAETGTEGRSAGKVIQSVEAHDLRTRSSVVENSQIVAANYVRQIEADRLTAKSSMKAAKAQYDNSVADPTQTFFNMITSTMKGAATGYSFGSMFGGAGAASSWYNVGGARGTATGTGGGYNMGGGVVSGL